MGPRAEVLAPIRAKASVRCAEALRLRQSGLTYKAIGEQLGGISHTMAMYLVRRGEREVGRDVSEAAWKRAAEEEQVNREAEKARIHAAWEAEDRAREAAAEASLKRAEDRLKRAWGRWQVKMYQARPARIAEPGEDNIVLGHALQQLWRQFIEPHGAWRRPLVGPYRRLHDWLDWRGSAGVTYRNIPGQLVSEWRVSA
jgi:hypothetical protein